MNTKSLVIVLVLMINILVSISQKITNLYFKGCLASTTFAQFSAKENTDISTAQAGWVSAVAAPEVNLNNISDIAFTFESYSTLGGKLETSPAPANAVPIDYSKAAQNPLGTNIPLIYSQSYVKTGKLLTTTPTTPPSWRKAQIFINPLTIGSLPIVIANSSKLQAGYSYAAEPVGNSHIQLHTNGQALFLAFNSPATQLKFQLENVGTTNETAGAVISVEKSNDLINWTKIEDIDIATMPQFIAGNEKKDYSFYLKDNSARFIRIKISGLPNSRKDRRINVRSLSVI